MDHSIATIPSTDNLVVGQLPIYLASLLPFPKGPVLSIAIDPFVCMVTDDPQLGDWLECYATALDLNVWLSSSIANATFSQDARTWQVDVNRGGQTRRMIVKHIVFATGFGGGYPKIPSISGKVRLPFVLYRAITKSYSGIIPWFCSALLRVYFCDRL
jgi:hypothetical protein